MGPGSEVEDDKTPTHTNISLKATRRPEDVDDSFHSHEMRSIEKIDKRSLYLNIPFRQMTDAAEQYFPMIGQLNEYGKIALMLSLQPRTKTTREKHEQLSFCKHQRKTDARLLRNIMGRPKDRRQENDGGKGWDSLQPGAKW